MKKSLLSTIAILSFTVTAFSQNKGFVSLNVGGASPSGDFASTDTNNDNASAATTGYSLDLSAGYKFHENIGAQILIRSQGNPMDKSYIEKQFSGLPAGTSYEVEAWGSASFLIGPYFSFNLNEEWDLEPRILIGSTAISSPKTTIKNGSTTIIQERTSGSGFGYLIGLGTKYSFSSKWFLGINLDYSGANAEIKDIKLIVNGVQQSTSKFDAKFRSVNFGVGIGYKF